VVSLDASERRAGLPLSGTVDVFDFPDPALGRAIRYGIHDMYANNGWVSGAATKTPP
jgi:hypothetical protein